jgi:hypothetical protein
MWGQSDLPRPYFLLGSGRYAIILLLARIALGLIGWQANHIGRRCPDTPHMVGFLPNDILRQFQTDLVPRIVDGRLAKC